MITVNIILSFIFVTIIGNALISAWQHNNWLWQQRFEKKSANINNLKEMFDDLVQLSSKRRYVMLRAVYAIKSGKREKIDEVRTQYDEVVKEWNLRLNEFLIKLVFHVGEDEMQRLEHDISRKFTDLGARIEKLIRDPKQSNRALLNNLENCLNVLNNEIFRLNRDIYRAIINTQRKEIFSEEYHIELVVLP